MFRYIGSCLWGVWEILQEVVLIDVYELITLKESHSFMSRLEGTLTKVARSCGWLIRKQIHEVQMMKYCPSLKSETQCEVQLECEVQLSLKLRLSLMVIDKYGYLIQDIQSLRNKLEDKHFEEGGIVTGQK